MSPLATLETGLFLGLYALLAGIWGVLWALAQLPDADRRRLGRCRLRAARAGGGHYRSMDAARVWLEVPDRR